MNRSSEPQRGAALIVALVIVAMVAVLAVSLSGDFLLMFRRVENQMYSEQAYAYLLGAEGVARAALLKDKQTDKTSSNGTDNLAEEWAKPQKFPTDYGWIAGQLEDLQGRFNLNALGSKKTTGEQNPLAPSEAQLVLQRLLLTLTLPEKLAPDEVEALVDAITDWIDKDEIVTRLAGAESQDYAGMEPRRLPANREIASPSELMWVKGMTPAIYRALKPLVTVWPAEGDFKINLNTAPPAVLASINGSKTLTPLDANDVQKLLADREAHGGVLDIESVKALLKADPLADATPYINGTSNVFELTARTDFQGRRYTLRSVLRRDDKTVRVIARTFGDW